MAHPIRATVLHPSTTQQGYKYRGALRDAQGRVEWTCEHLHANRDMSPGIRQSARDCAAAELARRTTEAAPKPGPVTCRTVVPHSDQGEAMSGDLTAFLRARLDEDEAEAKATADADAEFWADVKGDGTHFGLHDPARVLREVAAGRAILGLHHPTQPHPEFGFTYPGAAKFCGYDGPGDNWQAEHEPDHFPDALWPCWTVRLLAAVYSDHPGYRPEWKP